VSGRLGLFRRGLLVAGTLLCAGAIAGAGGSVTHAQAAGITVTVAPNTGLGPDQYVKVAWTGEASQQVVFFRQCTAAPTNVDTDCTKIYTDIGFSDTSGSGSLYEPVTQGAVHNGAGSTFPCDVTHACTIGVFTDATLTSGVFATVRFAPTPNDCPTPVGAPLSGGGADEGNFALYHWGLAMCQAPLRRNVSYIPANSEDGLQNFVNGLNDFAVTGMPVPAATLSLLKQKGRTFDYAPLTASGLVLAYKIFDQNVAFSEPGAQVTNLKLTPQLVAQIFTGQITNWQSSSAINALNPGNVFPPTVMALVRGDHSEANLLFTSWLTATGGTGLPSNWPAPSDNYPISYLDQNAAIVGGSALAQAIANPNTHNLNSDFFSVGYIGFVDASEAAYYGLPTVQIQNAAGQYVTATPASIDAALTDATTNADGVTITPDFTTTDPAAYPMPMVTYATVPTNHIAYGPAVTLRTFLKYAATTGQTTLPAGYVPLPAAMAQKTLATVPKVPLVKTKPSGGNGGGTGGNGGGSGGYTGNGSGSGSGSGYGGSGSTGSTHHHRSTRGPAPCSDGALAAGLGYRGTASPGKHTSCYHPKPKPKLPAATLASTSGHLVLPSIVGAGAVCLIGGLALETAGGQRRRRMRALLRRAPSLRPRLPRRGV